MFYFHTDQQYSFSIDNEGSTKIFYFSFLNEKEKLPIKLGDGTFGVVYQVHDNNRQPYAVKILYENKSLSQNTYSTLNDGIINEFANQFQYKDDAKILEQLQNLKEISQNLSLFLMKLKNLSISDQEFIFIVNQLIGNNRSVAVERFKQELGSAKKIHEELQSISLGRDFSGVVKIEGGTSFFHQSPGYKSLESIFKSSQLQVSTYALVMPLYEGTLKDLLEKGTGNYAIRGRDLIKAFPTSSIPQDIQAISDSPKVLEDAIDTKVDIKDDQKIQLKKDIYELSGYDLLRTMEFNDRISTILPYLIDITQGLKALHIARLSHHDIKPANIFVRSEGRRVESVIGDLGFLRSQTVISVNTASFHDALPLGTRHYRSPEQKDYFDICDISVEHQQDTDTGNTSLVLLVSDPKFHDSIIESGDWLIFSKDTMHKPYIIAAIDFKNDPISISLVGNPDQLMKDILPDKRTQIILYKKQAVRTDIFGLGSIVYDLITCGESPEKFYDNIRSYDREQIDINNLVKQYQQVSNYQSSEPGLVHVFDVFKHSQNSDYAPFEIVELILKCLFYKADNTFYKLHKDTASDNLGDHKAIDAILDQLLKIDNNPEYKGARFDNSLKDKTHKPSITRPSTLLEKEIASLQALPLEKFSLRLARGIWFFKSLVQLVRDNIEDNTIFLSEMLPKNIVVKSDTLGNPSSLGFTYSTYKSKSDYKDDLKKDTVHTKLVRDITNPYVPNYLTFMRRLIRLEKQFGKQDTFFYTFYESSSLLGDHIEIGDWIICDGNLWSIKSVKSNEITVMADDLGAREINIRNEQDNAIDCVYFSKIDPCIYYFNMLSIYIQHIFFTDLGSSSKSKPLIINIAQGVSSMNESPDSIILNLRAIKDTESAKKLDPILQFLAQMYSRLVFSNNEKSYYRQNKDDLLRILPIITDVRRLQLMIEMFTEEGAAKLDKLVTKIEKADSVTDKTLMSFNDKLEFDALLRSLITISIEKRGSSLFRR